MNKEKPAIPIYDAPYAGWQYIRASEIPEEYREEFSVWMRGQTMPVIIEDGKAIADAVYSWDWKRFLDWKFDGVEPVFD